MELVASAGAGALAVPGLAPSKPNKATARSVPAFLNKLYSMVADTATDDLIHWSDDGDSFFITSADRVAKELLPRFFKHSNFGSFVRQLNMYGFRKVPHLQHGVLKKDASDEADLLEFSNPNFTRAQPDLLCLIRRQKAKTGGEGGVGENGALDIPTLLTDLAAIRKHQTAISADLKDLQERNHALWQEAVQSREKHKKQEETINKILRFLAGVFGGQVLDAGAGQQGVQGVSPGGVGVASGSTSSGGAGEGGKGKGNGVVVMPKRGLRLLLEDVRGRQAERAAALKELDGDEEDEIEEIPLLDAEEDDDLPTISSSLVAAAPTASTSAARPPVGSSALAAYKAPSPARLNSSASDRFTAIPTPSPLNNPSPFDSSQFSGLSQDTINSLMQAAGNNPDALSAFFAGQAGASTSSALPTPLPTAAASSSAAPFFSNALIPSPSPSYLPSSSYGFPTSTPLDLTSLTSSSSVAPPPGFGTVSPTLSAEYAQNNAAISSLNSEAGDIGRRTAQLESQIASLMDSLPEEAREQVENATPGGAGADALGAIDWSAWGGDGGTDWASMLQQFTDGNDITSQLPTAVPTPSADTPGIDFSSFLTDPSSSSSSTPLDASLAALSGSSLPPLPGFTSSSAQHQQPYEVTSPAGNILGDIGSPASTVGSVNGDAASVGGKKAGAAGRKRKSDVLGGDSPAAEEDPASPAASDVGVGTRRSARKRKA
ncbi:hypothetical protein JCM8097_007742 [Rhodosporidiobolus ruineniae]